VDRADTTAILLVIAGLVSTASFLLFVPDAFISYKYAAFLVITVPTYSYSVYWAFSIRRVLAVRLYRNQALGMGVIVIAIWLTLGVFFTTQSLSSLQLTTAWSTLSFYFLIVVLFYWIDASMLASRRSDPLLRDTLYWSKLRIPLWGLNFVTIGVVLTILGYAEITDNVTLLNSLNSGDFSNFILAVMYNFLSVITLFCGVIFLPAIAIRAKWNKTLRKHFAWFALFAVLLFILLMGSLPPPIGPALVLGIGYTLYRSSKSLVPLNRISPLDVVPKVEPPPP